MATTVGTRARQPSGLAGFIQRKVMGCQTLTAAREALWGYAFAMPWVLGLLIFVGGPIIASFVLSFTDYNIVRAPRWAGIANYTQAFVQDELFWPSLRRTFYYAIMVVPIGLVGSLLLALALNQGLKGTTIFRTLFFIPHLTPTVAMAILWQWILHPQVGPLNYALTRIGVASPPGWLSEPKWAIPSLILISTWSGVGGNRMLIFLAGLQGVPDEFYEAAEIDGAGGMAKFWHITLPMLSPTILFNLILGVIGALQVFAMAFVATEGGPAWATWFFALHIYRNAFQYFKMGYASALAWIFVAIVMSLTYLQLSLSNRWVYYAG